MLFSGSLTMGLALRDIHTPVKINVALIELIKANYLYYPYCKRVHVVEVSKMKL